MPSISPTRINRSTHQMELDLVLEESMLDDRIEAAYAIVELGERGSKKGDESPTTEVEEDLEDDPDHQVPRSPECRRQDLRRHFSHSTDSSPARTPTKNVESHQPKVAHVRGAVMPSRGNGRSVQAVRSKRRLEEDGSYNEGIKMKLARMLFEKKYSQGELIKSTLQDGNDSLSRTDDGVDSEEERGTASECGKFVRTSVPLLEPIPFAHIGLQAHCELRNTQDAPQIKSEKLYSDDEAKNFNSSVWNERDNLCETNNYSNAYAELLRNRHWMNMNEEVQNSNVLKKSDDTLPQNSRARSITKDMKSETSKDFHNPLLSLEAPVFTNKYHGFDAVPKENLYVAARNMDAANLSRFPMDRRVEPSTFGVIPSWQVSNYLSPFVFLGSTKEMQLKSGEELWRYIRDPTLITSARSREPVMPEYHPNVKMEKSLETERMVEARRLEKQAYSSPAVKFDQVQHDSTPLYYPRSFTRSYYPQFGSLNSINRYYNTAVSETADCPSNLMESKSCDDLKMNSQKLTNTQDRVMPRFTPTDRVKNNECQRPQSNSSNQSCSRKTQKQNSAKASPRVSKPGPKTSALADALKMVKGGEFGSLKTIRQFYNSLKSRRKSDAPECLQHEDTGKNLSPKSKNDSQDFPLDLSSYRRRLSLELRNDVKCFSSLAEIHDEASGKLTDNPVSKIEMNDRVPAYPPSETGDSPSVEKSPTSSLSSVFPNSHLPPKKRKIRQLSQSDNFAEIKPTSNPMSTSSCHRSPEDSLHLEHLKHTSSRVGEYELPFSRNIQQLESHKHISSAETRLFLEPKLLAHRVTEESSLFAAAAVQDEDGDLPLHIAVVQGSIDVVRKLVPVMLQLGVSVDTCNKNRQTALHLAVISNQPQMVDLLLRASASPNACDRKGNTAIHLAIKYKTLTCLNHILANSRISLDLDAKNYEGLTALHIGVQLCQLDAVKALLATGADSNVTDGTNGRTPLFYAVETNDYVMASILLKYGSDPCIASYSGCTPLQIAAAKSFRDMASILEGSSQRGYEATVGFT